MWYKRIRNIHLFTGLFCCAFLFMYGVSAMQMAHPGVFSTKPQITASHLILQSGLAARSAAQVLIEKHGFRGELEDPKQTSAGWSFTIARPGARYDVDYNLSTGATRVRTSRANVLFTLNRIHHVSGFGYTFVPLAVISLCVVVVSAGLFVLGASGIFMWFKLHRERAPGIVLLACSLAYGLGLLIIVRLS